MPPVDLALVLAVDASASVTFDEFNLIAGGLAEALRDPAVTRGLTGGPNHTSLCALIIFSGANAAEIMVGWTRIASREDALTFAERVELMPRIVRPGLTAIGAALLAAFALLATAPAQAKRRIVDIAGDGRSNDGPPPGPVRDRMVSVGITINGLCVLHEEPDLVATFTREVIGGPGAFALPCPDYPAFSEAMRRKLLREVSETPMV
jgi:Ca-activated chloride channel homolog